MLSAEGTIGSSFGVKRVVKLSFVNVPATLTIDCEQRSGCQFVVQWNRQRFRDARTRCSLQLYVAAAYFDDVESVALQNGDDRSAAEAPQLRH
jgi:hypothetical protein